MRVSDEELMLRSRQGDMGAFELLVSRHKDAIFNFIYHFLGDYHRAQDVSQETFLRVLKNVDRYKSRDRFKTWLYRIAANLCKNELRDRSRHKTLSLNDPDIDLGKLSSHVYLSPVETSERDELRELVRNALLSLPEDQRMAIVMREYQDLTYEEIASAMSCSVSAVKSKIYRARQNFKEAFVNANIA